MKQRLTLILSAILGRLNWNLKLQQRPVIAETNGAMPSLRLAYSNYTAPFWTIVTRATEAPNAMSCPKQFTKLTVFRRFKDFLKKKIRLWLWQSECKNIKIKSKKREGKKAMGCNESINTEDISTFCNYIFMCVCGRLCAVSLEIESVLSFMSKVRN